MERNFPRSLDEVLFHEGEFVDHPDDPGGATNKGITIGAFRRHVKRDGTVDDLKNITDEPVAKVYRKHYWDKIRGDDLPDGLDYAVFDFAVNSGPGRAAKFLQEIVGATVDGGIGPETLLKVKSYQPSELIKSLTDDRLQFLMRLKHWDTFKNGWATRVSDVERLSLEMAGAHEEPKSTTGTPAIWIIVALAIAAIAAFIIFKST